MSYVESNLMPGERIAYRAHLHWIVYGNWAGLALVFLVVALAAKNGVFVLLAALSFVPPYIKVKTSEFAVTDQRVLIKVGWLQRRSIETLLDKVEGIAVEQGIFGRLYGYGTIVVAGTGGTHERFKMIAQPLEFRKQ